jgi:hypothetical protein
VTSTCCAGAVAPGSFPKKTVYPSGLRPEIYWATPVPDGPTMALGSRLCTGVIGGVVVVPPDEPPGGTKIHDPPPLLPVGFHCQHGTNTVCCPGGTPQTEVVGDRGDRDSNPWNCSGTSPSYSPTHSGNLTTDPVGLDKQVHHQVDQAVERQCLRTDQIDLLRRIGRKSQR